jgi:hypothetical protein
LLTVNAQTLRSPNTAGPAFRHSAITALALLLFLQTAELPAQDFTYTNTNGTITITGYTGPGGNVPIPSTIDGLPVTCIGFDSFGANYSLTSVTIPDSVTNIQNAEVGGFGLGDYGGVFWGCTNLTNVVVGKGLSYLGLGAFSGCTNLLSVYFKGDAPTPGTFMPGPVYVFGNDDPTTVYYLPGTSGWGVTYAGRPAVLWNATVQTNNSSFGVRQNRFGFDISGTPDIPLVVEASTNLAAESWVQLQSCTLTNGLIYFSDAQWSSYPSRLYRIRSP